MVETILVGLYFILCQIIVIKKKYPAFLQPSKASHTLMLGIALIIMSIIIVHLFHWNYFLPIAVTIFMGSIILDKYLQIFEKLDQGKKV